MTRSARSRLLLWLAVVAVGALIGYAYTRIAYPAEGIEAIPPLRGMRTGAFIAGATSAFEIFGMRMRFGRWLKSLPMASSFLLRAVIQTGIIMLLLQLNVRIFAYNEAGLLYVYNRHDFFIDTLFSIVAMSAVLFVIQMRQLIGPRTFGSLLTGRYHKPQVEERIFVIFDIAGSTVIARQLGDEDFHAFVSSVFFDIDAPIVDHGGEVMSFVGDALIADWPLRGEARNSDAIAATFMVMQKLDAVSSGYQERFGVTPRLRAVLHGGTVVAGETGDSRRQITYLGDVLNIASRIESVAKQTGNDVVISEHLLIRSALPAGVTARALGSFELKGVDQPLAISALEMSPSVQ